MSSGSNGAPSFLSGLSGVNTRVKTYSESSDGAAANSPGVGRQVSMSSVDSGKTDSTQRLNEVQSDTLYDLDGKFPYSYYSNNAQMYDIDGKVKVKFFNHLRYYKNSLLKKEIGVQRSNSESATEDEEQMRGRSQSLGAKAYEGITRPKPAGFQRSSMLYDLEGKVTFETYDPKTHAHRFRTYHPSGPQ